MNPKKLLHTLSSAVIYFICLLLWVPVITLSCSNYLVESNIEGKESSILLNFDRETLEDASGQENREVVATFHLPATTNLSACKLHVQVQVVPTMGGDGSKLDCTSKVIKKVKDPHLAPMASLYQFLPNNHNDQPLTAKFIFKPAVSVSEMKAQFTLLHDNKPAGTPTTVTWQAIPQIEWVDIIDGQEIKYGDKVMVGLKNVGSRIIHPHEVVIQLSNSNNLSILDNSGKNLTNGADLTAFLGEESKKPINPYEKVQFTLQPQPANEQPLQVTQLRAIYKQQVVATKNIKLVSKHTKHLKVVVPEQDGAILRGYGPFEIILQNTGNYPIKLGEVGVQVNTSIKFFLNNLATTNSKDDTLARLCNLQVLEKGKKASLSLLLQPGTFTSSQLAIVLYELDDPTKVLAHRLVTWEYNKHTQLKIYPIEDSIKIKDGQITSQIRLTNTGTQPLQLNNNLMLLLEDFSPVVDARMPRFDLRYAIKNSAPASYLGPNESVTLDLTSNPVDAFDKVDFIAATIAVYYHDGKSAENRNKPLDKCKITWERKK